MARAVVIKILGGGGSQPCEVEVTAPNLGISRFDWKPYGVYGASLHDIGKRTPTEAGFISAAPVQVRRALAAAETIDIELPDDELAALNWEHLSPAGLVRRDPIGPTEMAVRLNFPIHMAVLLPEGSESHDLMRSLGNLLGSDLKNGRIVVDVKQVGDAEEIRDVLGSHRYEVVHLSLPTAVRQSRPCVVLGRNAVLTKQSVTDFVSVTVVEADFKGCGQISPTNLLPHPLKSDVYELENGAAISRVFGRILLDPRHSSPPALESVGPCNLAVSHRPVCKCRSPLVSGEVGIATYYEVFAVRNSSAQLHHSRQSLCRCSGCSTASQLS